MSRPIVVIACMPGSSESWELQQHPHLWHSRAGGGAVHSIISGCRALKIAMSALPPTTDIDRRAYDMLKQVGAHNVAANPLPNTSRFRISRVAALLRRIRLALAQVDRPGHRAARHRHPAQLPLLRTGLHPSR